MRSQCAWIEALCRHTFPNPEPSRYDATAIMQIRWRRSFASPLCFNAGQLPPHRPQIYPILPKSLDLCLDVCQNAIDLLTSTGIVSPTGLK